MPQQLPGSQAASSLLSVFTKASPSSHGYLQTADQWRGMFESCQEVKVDGGIFQMSTGPTINNYFPERPEVSHTSQGHVKPIICEQEDDIEAKSPPKADYQVYYDQLITKRRGLPLWVPGPSMTLPIPYRTDGISIGDVGIYYHFGTFEFLFNVLLPADHVINAGRVPEEFRPLDHSAIQIDISKNLIYGPDSYLSSSSLCKTNNFDSSGFIFETSDKEGAILIMPDGAVSLDLLNHSSEAMTKYLGDHAESWYKYVIHTRGRTVENGGIRLVVGCDKLSSWGIATFVSSFEQRVRLEFKGVKDDRTTSILYSWDCLGTGCGRAGPHDEETSDLKPEGGPPLRNQCAFVRTMNITLSERTWNKIPKNSSAFTGMPTYYTTTGTQMLDQAPYQLQIPPSEYWCAEENPEDSHFTCRFVPDKLFQTLKSFFRKHAWNARRWKRPTTTGTGVLLTHRREASYECQQLRRTANVGLFQTLTSFFRKHALTDRRSETYEPGFSTRLRARYPFQTLTSFCKYALNALPWKRPIRSTTGAADTLTPLTYNPSFASSRQTFLSNASKPRSGHAELSTDSPKVNLAQSKTSVTHPLVFLNKYLFEKYPNAKMVLTQEADWMSVISKEDITLPNPEEICDRILASHDICEEDGIITLKQKASEQVLSSTVVPL